MDTNELLSAMQQISKCSILKPNVYVIANDEMQFLRKTLPWVIIQNTGNKNTEGYHWILWMNLNKIKRNLTYFDSYGLSTDYYKLHLPFKDKTNILNKNTVQLQEDDSNVCGMYCLYIMYNSVNGRSFDSILSDFNPYQRSTNDKIVLSFYNNLSFCRLKVRIKCQNCCSKNYFHTILFGKPK